MKRFLFSLLLLSSCADGYAEISVSQKLPLPIATVFGVEEGSPKADAILNVVNTFEQSELRNDVQLFSQATTNVLLTRANGEIGSLAELDAVPFVGPQSFAVLERYVDNTILLVNQEWTGSINGDQSLVFRFSATSGQNLRFSLRQIDGTSWNPRVRLYGEAGRLLSRNPRGNVDVDEPLTLPSSEIFDLVIANTGPVSYTHLTLPTKRIV